MQMMVSRFALPTVGLAVLVVSVCAPVCAGPVDLVSETVAPGIRVNGVALTVSRLTGAGVEAYAQRLRETWRREGEMPSPWVDAGDWRVMSRRAGRWSEVLQVRKGAHPTEALLSRVDLRHPPTPVPRLTLGLPAACRVVSTVELGTAADRAIQVSARCTAAEAQVYAELRRRAQAAGWRIQGRGGGPLQQLTRGSTQLTLLLGGNVRRTMEGQTWMVAFEREQLGPSP
jgi:hypothetical protein